jgi:plastocyanin domain-containing protein
MHRPHGFFPLARSKPFLVGLIASFGALACVVSGCSACGRTEAEQQPKPAPTEQPGPDLSEVDVAVGPTGFMPSEVHWTRGVPLSLVFKRFREDACGTEVSIPALNIVRSLPLRESVSVSVSAVTPGKYEFKCGSGAYVGHLFIF